MLTFVKHASPFVPLMFMAQDPQMPSLHTAALVRTFASLDLWDTAHRCSSMSHSKAWLDWKAYLQDLLNARVGSISSLILNSTSSIMGPQLQKIGISSGRGSAAGSDDWEAAILEYIRQSRSYLLMSTS